MTTTIKHNILTQYKIVIQTATVMIAVNQITFPQPVAGNHNRAHLTGNS